MALHQALPWHEGEEKMHALTGVPPQDNPNNPGLSPRGAQQIQIYPLMAIGTTDKNDDNRPWTTLWGGEAPMSQPIAPGGVIGIKAGVDASFDPVVNSLLGKKADGEVVREREGTMISALSISLEARSRVKLYGRMIAGALSTNDNHPEDGHPQTIKNTNEGISCDAQLVMKVEQSLGNCPKYINKKKISSYPHAKPRLMSEDIILSQEVVEHVQNADMFFISSSHKFEDMDTNHRGGPPGFLRVQQPGNSSPVPASTLVWPEYSGNNLYQTLGNLMTTPRAGIVIPDFTTGNVLYMTGDTRVLVDEEANAVLPKSKLAVAFTIHAARFVHDGLGFRGEPVDDGPTHGRSPYNPKIRFLREERNIEFPKNYGNENTIHGSGSNGKVTAKLIRKQLLSPTITKYRFSLSDPSVYGPWKPGQYVALDFSEDLNMGWVHMRDDDPASLNDDFIRTFTVASQPTLLGMHGEEFEVMVRNVGNVTRWLSWQREGLTEVEVLGFGGEFSFGDKGSGHERKVFVAQGIGITPLLGQIGTIENIKVRWTINFKDIGAVANVIRACSDTIRKGMIIYLTGKEEGVHDDYKKYVAETDNLGVCIIKRRMMQEDLTVLLDETDEWYMCAAPAMRKVIQDWLPGKSIVFENFDY